MLKHDILFHIFDIYGWISGLLFNHKLFTILSYQEKEYSFFGKQIFEQKNFNGEFLLSSIITHST